MSSTVDVFIDLSNSGGARTSILETIARLAHGERLGSVARRLTGVLPPGWPSDGLPKAPEGWHFETASSVHMLNGALTVAARDRMPLLVLVGPVDVTCEAVGVLRQCLERDPMFGFTVPRIGCADRCCVARLTRYGLGRTDWVARRMLADVPETEIFVEIVSPCMLVAPVVVGNCNLVDRRLEGIATAMLHYISGARRFGFRTVVANRVVVGLDGSSCDVKQVEPLEDLSARDLSSLENLVPDLARNWQQFRAGSWERFEKLWTVAMVPPGSHGRPSLLLDLRNLTAIYNGTSQAVLGAAMAIKAIASDWDVAFLANSGAAAFHGLEKAFGPGLVHVMPPDRPFTAALRLAQPWHIQEMVDLHNLSLFNAYLMLDTIAWDIAYLGPPFLEDTWQFLADHADGLLFDSEYTRQRFLERFPTGCSVPGAVTHLSFAPDEYVRAGARNVTDKDFILVIGNNLDHKDVRSTVDTLVSGFPFRHFKVLGTADVVSPFVTTQRSGGLSELDLHRLYASAEFVVFPSLYEGFGFPVVTALAYGRTVLARRSDLLEEIAAQCDPHRGRLVMFDRREDLVELIGRLAHGEEVPYAALGRSIGNRRPKAWHHLAREALDFMESLAGDPSRSRWIARERAVRQFQAYR